jgi:hypothetical protein
MNGAANHSRFGPAGARLDNRRASVRATWLRGQKRVSSQEMNEPKSLFKYYVEGARTIYGVIKASRESQAPFEPSDFGKAMDLLEHDLLIGIQKRFQQYGPKGSPAALKQFLRMFLEANQ